MHYLGTFSWSFKNLFSYFKSALLAFSNCKISKKCKKLEPKMPYLGTFDWSLKKLLSYLKSAPSILSNCKILPKKKKA